MQRDAIVRSLLDAQGNKNEAARALGVSRATFYPGPRRWALALPPQETSLGSIDPHLLTIDHNVGSISSRGILRKEAMRPGERER
ncbi:helix-turn-helix domain-containing protein [Actinacidiphila soli]|uniref:helix-turn-helix domain-containing protein n=1 Tax=Actinacidiphila soli TaxID=2487275 RepID=UPI000FCC7474